VKLGLLPGGGGTQRLARRAGTMWTKELVMTGRTVLPEEAKEHGVVLAVVPPEQLQDEALALADRLVAGAPTAVREAKRLIDDGVLQDLSAGLTAEQRVLSRLFASPDGQEGVRAFVEKRPPVFRGATQETAGRGNAE
jgi:enoyl-CoA hydratase